jgi:hypothetical protein
MDSQAGLYLIIAMALDNEHLTGTSGWCWCMPRMERYSATRARIWHRVYWDRPDPVPDPVVFDSPSA